MARKKGPKGGTRRPEAASERRRPEAHPPGPSAGSSSSSASPPSVDGPVPAAWLGGALALSAVGAVAAVYLTSLHIDLFYGAGVQEALCDFGGAFDCSTVNGSDWSHVGPVPIALIGLPAYAVTAFLAWRTRQDGRGSAANALLLALGAAMAAYSVFLAAVSAFVLQAYCAVCIGMYAVNLALPALAWWISGLSVGELAARAVAALRPGALMAQAAGVFVAVAIVGGGAYAGARSAAISAATAVALGEEPETSDAGLPETPVLPPSGEVSGGEVKPYRIQPASTKIRAGAAAFALGPVDAPVQALAFSDFQCPFCKRLAGTVHQVHEEYPEQVRVVFLQFPMHLDCNAAPLKKSLHPEACAAAAAAVCAGDQGRFVAAHDLLFQEQGRLGEGLFVGLAARLGLDSSRYEACRRDPGTRERILADTRLGAEAGIDGTPNLVVNGRVLAGARPIEVLRAIVDAELKRTEGLLDLEVRVGTERIGAVEAASTVQVGGFQIDAFEGAIVGGKALSEAGRAVSGGVSWYEAQAACEASGKRLCTEREYLRACMGAEPVDADGDGTFSDDAPTGRFYAYGGLYREGACADNRNPEAPGELIAGTHPGCATPDGIYDLHGNVKEWVGLDPASAALMGGSYFSGDSARCTYRREDIAPDTKDPANGFRCCEGPAAVPDAARFSGGKPGDELAAFTVDRLDGKGTIRSKDLIGKPTIVTFWASWCGPCRVEMPILSQLAEKYRDQGLRVLAISIDDGAEAARAFLLKNPMSFDVAHDPGGAAVKSRFMAEAIPATFWVRADGVIRQRTVGVPNGGERRLDELAQELIEAR